MAKPVNAAAKALSLPQFRRTRVVKDKKRAVKNGETRFKMKETRDD